jgi:hypothetical protein
MTDWITLVWIAGGMLAGTLHVAMLARSSDNPSHWTPLSGMLRLVTVTAFLIAAALNGGILAAAAGWAVGFAVVSALVVLRLASSRKENRPGESYERPR